MNRIFSVRVIPSLFLLAAMGAAAQAQTQDPAALASFQNAVQQAGQDDKSAAAKQGQQSPVESRGALNDNQDPAPRPGNMTLDPKFRGFIPVPNTPVIIKFNAKPRADLTIDNQNSGDDNRFITAKIPVNAAGGEGGGTVFNINAKASQLSVDVRAPEIDGSPRFYYQNDFFGSGPGEFPYRVRQLYGQIYNVIVGQTFSVFEDPDVWPDTVDYEGPNSAIFARRPLARYMLPLNAEWQLNFGVEQPESEIDISGSPGAAPVNHSPDLGVNARWEQADLGHVQIAAIFRELAVRGGTLGSDSTFAWGLNLSGVFSVTKMDSIQAQLTYGHGLFRYCNDDFSNNDAAFDSSGNLRALPYLGILVGFTHRWSEEWRSSFSYGYVNVDNEPSQGGGAYHVTHYASANVVWQIRKRLSLGLEGLYGSLETQNGDRGNVFRVQFGLLYSLFD